MNTFRGEVPAYYTMGVERTLCSAKSIMAHWQPILIQCATFLNLCVLRVVYRSNENRVLKIHDRVFRQALEQHEYENIS